MDQILVRYEEYQRQAEAGVAKADRVRSHNVKSLREAAWYSKRPEWHASVPYQVVDYGMMDALTAFKNFATGVTKLPRFTKKGRDEDRFSFQGRYVTLEVGRVKLPHMGWVRLAGADPAQARLRRLLRKGRAKLNRVTVRRHGDGSWWIAIGVEQPVRQPREHPHEDRPVIGVDRGIKVNAVAVTAEGEVVHLLERIGVLRDATKKIRRAQRIIERRLRPDSEPESRNCRKARLRAGKLHAKLRRQRADALHGFSRLLTQENPVIVVEDLATHNMSQNWRLRYSIADQGWGLLGKQLEYKSRWIGGLLLKVQRSFPSSKMCSGCGVVKAKLLLNVRVYRCTSCGLVMDRDENAGVNLAVWGEMQLGIVEGLLDAVVAAPAAPERVPGPSGLEEASVPRACGGGASVKPSHHVGALPSAETGTCLPARE